MRTMKSLNIFATIIALFCLVCMTQTAAAGGSLALDRGGAAIQEFAPSGGITYASATKGTTTIPVTGYAMIRYITSADTTFTLNGAGSSYLVKANIEGTFAIPRTVTSVVFSRTSSATATKIYVMTQK